MSVIDAGRAVPDGKRPLAPQNLATAAVTPSAAKKGGVIGMWTFAIMNVTTIVSLRGMPSQAEYGLTSIFYYVFAVSKLELVVKLGFEFTLHLT